MSDSKRKDGHCCATGLDASTAVSKLAPKRRVKESWYKLLAKVADFRAFASLDTFCALAARFAKSVLRAALGAVVLIVIAKLCSVVNNVVAARMDLAGTSGRSNTAARAAPVLQNVFIFALSVLAPAVLLISVGTAKSISTAASDRRRKCTGPFPELC